MTDILIRPFNPLKGVAPKDGKTYTLEELQNYVGGTIEIIAMRSGQFMVINDAGKLLGLDFNTRATVIYNKQVNERDFIVGPALIVDAKHID